jgi:hypothetical protein
MFHSVSFVEVEKRWGEKGEREEEGQEGLGQNYRNHCRLCYFKSVIPWPLDPSKKGKGLFKNDKICFLLILV